MFVRPAAVRRHSLHTGHAVLLASVSVVALFMANPQAVARQLGGYAPAPSQAAIAAAQSGAQEAQRIAQQAQNSLKRATMAIQAMQATQQAARDAARNALTGVTNGLSAGGLVVDPRVKAGDTSLWQNVSLPVETTSNGKTKVTLTQSAKRAIATWQQFDVGRDTMVYFDQSAGNSANGNSWVILNRIDAAGRPSQIQGQIKAEGTVLLINPNGIIFSGSSQINVHSFIASSMDLNSFTGAGAFKQNGDAYVPVLVNGLAQSASNGTALLAPSDEANANKTFMNSGLFTNNSFWVPGTSISAGQSALFSAGQIPGQSNTGVRVEAGASISTDVSGFDNGGFVALLGPQVSNAGSIATSAGQIILAAGSSVQIAEPAANTTQTTYAVRSGSSIDTTLFYIPPAVEGGGLALNDVNGLLVSKRGNITMVGDKVDQSGLAEATTSITRTGSIVIAANAVGPSQIRFGGQSLTTILPEENGETIPSDAASLASFKAPRIDVSGTSIDFQSGSWVLAPSATMAVTGPGGSAFVDIPPGGRVLMEAGSVIDLSGLTATRSVSDYLFTFKVTSNDVADTPLAKSLIGQTVTIDLSLTGTRADGKTWVGSPLFASSGAGYLSNITQGITQLLTKGGSLTFGSSVSIADGRNTGSFNDVLFAPGSTINVSGGSISYTGATIRTSRVMSASGISYDIGRADPFVAYSGIDSGFTRRHDHWSLSESWSNPLTKSSYYKAGYVNGVSAGAIAMSAVNPLLEGDIVGDIVIGTNQRMLAQKGTGTNGAQVTPDQLPNGASLSVTLTPKGDKDGPLATVVLASSATDVLGAEFTVDTDLTLPARPDGGAVITYSTDRLSSYHLGSISISGADTLSVTEGANLSVRDGGSIKLGSVSTIDGTLTARSGNITISGVPARQKPNATLPDVILGTHALLDVSGQWVNDSGNNFNGALYIDGGSVSLSAQNLSEMISLDRNMGVVTATDLSPSIILEKGSVIDLSSGGYVGANGKLAVGSDGLPKGKGGNLSLMTYSGIWMSSTGIDPNSNFSNTVTFAPQTATNANIIMDGTIHAGGFSQGGTLTLQAPQITIDGQATKVTTITEGTEAGTLVLPTSFFTDSGFGNYKLISTYGSTTVTAGTTLTLKQQNYLATSIANLPATGARVRDFASMGYALDGMRHAVDLSLTQNAYVWGVAGDRSANAQLLIDEGARIVGDPLANIALTAGGPAIVLGGIKAAGGSITINQGYSSTFQLHDGLAQYMWIGENAVLDVAGAFVPNPLVTAYSTGTALPGGSITLSGPGAMVVRAGSVFDISGASGTIDVPMVGGLSGSRMATQQVWSNGGSLTIFSNSTSAAITSLSNSLYFAGTIHAAGGAPQAAGGTLNISNAIPGGGILISQSGDVASFAAGVLPATGAQLQALLPPTTRVTSFITADTINTANSGLDSVSLTGPLFFSGNVDLKVAGSILIDNMAATTLLPAGVINTTTLVPGCALAGSCIPTIGATNVTLEAGYIRLYNGANGATSLPTLADGTLTLKASEGIDLAGVPVVNNAGTINLVSGGDIRLTGLITYRNETLGVVATSDGNGAFPWVGAFLVADNLNMTARTIYPATNTAFLLMSRSLAPTDAPGTHNTITFASNGETPVAPLSAGGALIVDAKTIVQGGALYAPLGTIQLGFGTGQTLPRIFNGGNNNPYNPLQLTSFGILGPQVPTVTTDSVTLLPGSVTSVSANGLMIPYGNTVDGTNWTANGTLLNGPPSKLVLLGGATVDTRAGAVIDGSGGGDIYATEFVPGTGGSRNVLTNAGQTVYALVPGYGSALAAYDPSFTTSVAAGSTITLPGGNGIPAGTYTLLPAEYATMPGAYRVVLVSNSVNPQTKTATMPDGSVYMTGVLGNALNGSRSSQTALVQIQSNDVWTKYSEIDITKGANYFPALAADADKAAPRLAADAARIVVTAGTSLQLNATNLFAPTEGGLGGQLDITGANLVVAASDRLDTFGTMVNGTFTPNSDYAGYLFVDPDMLSRLGIESTLIGGYRSQTAEGTLITATALNLEISTNAAHALSGPDLLFTSLAPTSADPTMRGLVVNAGSVIRAQGTVAGNASSALVIGVDPVPTYTPAGAIQSWSAGISGDGALLRVSNGGLVNVVRHFVPGVYQVPATTPAPTGPISTVARGSLSVETNAVLFGNTLTLDSSGTTNLANGASLTAKNYDLSGSVINLGGGSGGLVVTPDLIGKLAGADVVRLRSASVFNIYGSNAFGDASNPIGTLTLDAGGFYSDGGTTSISARDIVFVNSQGAANLSGANTNGSGGRLIVDASRTLAFAGGSKTLSGFAEVNGTAGAQVLFTGTGNLDAKASAVNLTAPLFLVDAATVQAMTTTGALSLKQGNGDAPSISPTIAGGILALAGGSVDVSGRLVAQGGTLTLEATTGNLTLSGHGSVSAAGTRITIGDLIQDTPAGNIRLFANVGDLTLGDGSTVDVSGAGSGYAGSLSIFAGGAAALHGTLNGAARYSDLGGELTLIANRLDTPLPFTAGFTRSFAVSLGQGDIAIAAGQTLKSENVLLVANSGGIFVDGTIDASSASGGIIALYGAGTSTAAAGTAGASGVTIGSNARLYARYQTPDQNSPGYAKGASTLVQRGGTITLGTTGTPDGTLNDDYGYQNVQGSGAITVAAGALFDVSGGAGGASIDNTGGSVIIRAPILTNHAINVSFNGTVVTNAKADGLASGNPLVANAFAVWSTTDASTDPNQHFDGIIDPAGFFDAAGTRIISATDGLYPTSTPEAPADGAYLPHVGFYQTTLVNFVNNPFDTNAVAAGFAGARLKVGGNAETALPTSSLHLRPEIDLVNPSTSINNGNITVASNWNFGAGTIDGQGNINLAYRTTNGREPGTLTLRAANNVKINATITDGFFVPYIPPATDANGAYLLESTSAAYLAYANMFGPNGLVYDGSQYYNLTFSEPPYMSASAAAWFFNSTIPGFEYTTSNDQFDALQFRLQAPIVMTGDARVIDQYNQFYMQYVNMFHAYVTAIVAGNTNAGTDPNALGGPAGYGGYFGYADVVNLLANYGVSAVMPLAIPGAPNEANPYLYYNLRSGTRPGVGDDYASQWENYFYSVIDANLQSMGPLGIGPGSLDAALNGQPRSLAAAAGIDAPYCLMCFAVTPPSAPLAYTRVFEDTYVAAPPVAAPPPPVPNLIANNPGIYSVNNAAFINTTSSVNLMTAAASGKGSFSYDFVGGGLFNANGASSVNPNAVVQLSSLSSVVTGNVTVDGHTTYVSPLNGLTLDVPTLVRTGTGSITIAAAGDFALLDRIAPAAIYTAGYVAENAADFTVPTIPTIKNSSGLLTTPVWATGGGNIIVTAGRDIIGIETPVDPDGTRLRADAGDMTQGVSTGQFWNSWYYVNGKSTGSATAPFDPSAGGTQYSSWVNYGSFFQGFGALAGGNITLQAGRDIDEVSASLPETIQMSGGQSAGGPAVTAHYYGGGNLVVKAGNDIISGLYYVGRGTGSIRAGGNVVAGATLNQTYYVSGVPTIGNPNNNQSTPFLVPFLLAVQDGYVNVQAAGSIDLGGVFQPTRLPADLYKNLARSTYNQGAAASTLTTANGAFFNSYGPNSGVALSSSTGSVAVNTLQQTDNGSGPAYTLFQHGINGYAYIAGAIPGNIITPNLSVTALTGDIKLANDLILYPSQTAQLSLIAGGTINGTVPLGSGTRAIGITMTDTGLPPLGDDGPALIYAGKDIDGGLFTLSKPTRMWAGRDIAGVIFTGVNTDDDDITSIVAGRDILARRVPDVLGKGVILTSTSFTLYGPGDFVLEAGRNLGPFTTYTNDFIANNPTRNMGGGIFAIGDGSNSIYDTTPRKPYLPAQGANISLRYGVGNGIDYAAAIATYGDVAMAASSGIDFVSGIIPKLESVLKDLIVAQAKAAGIANPDISLTLTPSEAADLFNALPTLSINGKLDALAAKAGLNGLSFNLTPAQFVSLLQQRDAMKLEIDRGFLGVLAQVAKDYNNPSSAYSGKYGRAYEAIATLFPASMGYTDNSAGGSGTVPTLVHTGDLRMPRTLVQTQTGGDINLIGPGGNAFVGSNSADTLSPAQQGILTLQGGSVRSYSDSSVMVYQSRIFTQQGGNIELFSANGDLNAGKGPKSSAAYPPLRLICDADGYCRVNPAGLVTGAGIGALLSVPGQDPSLSDVVLAAPHGTVDFGAAGVRVAGNLNVLAVQVLNSFNANVGGISIGVPTAATANVGALTNASNTAGASAQAAATPKSAVNEQPSIIIVEVLGFGGGDGSGNSNSNSNPPSGDERDRERRADSQTQDPRNRVQILDGGELTTAQRRQLVEERRLMVGR